MTRVGVVSDTHGLLRPEAIAALRGCDHLIHAGDIGPRAVLEALAALAPLTAIRGNNDRDDWARAWPETATLQFEGVRLHVLHDLACLALDTRAEGIDVVVAGHSHRPSIEWRDGVLHLNPGSAGPRRFRLPVTLAHLEIDGNQAAARIVALEPLTRDAVSRPANARRCS